MAGTEDEVEDGPKANSVRVATATKQPRANLSGAEIAERGGPGGVASPPQAEETGDKKEDCEGWDPGGDGSR